jgi:hypothetical protein
MTRPGGGLTAQLDERGELAYLADGPWKGHWYWRRDLEQKQRAAQRMGYSPDHPAGVMRGYHPTKTWRPHPSDHPADTDLQGREWHYKEAGDEPAPLPHPGHGIPRLDGSVGDRSRHFHLAPDPGDHHRRRVPFADRRARSG